MFQTCLDQMCYKIFLCLAFSPLTYFFSPFFFTSTLFLLSINTSIFPYAEQSLSPNVAESLQKDILKMNTARAKPEKAATRWKNGSDASDGEHNMNLTSPIPLPALPANASSGRGIYYV